MIFYNLQTICIKIPIIFCSTDLKEIKELKLSSKYFSETYSKLRRSNFVSVCFIVQMNLPRFFSNQVWLVNLITTAWWSLRPGDVWLEITLLGWLVKHRSRMLLCHVGYETNCFRWNSSEISISSFLNNVYAKQKQPRGC